MDIVVRKNGRQTKIEPYFRSDGEDFVLFHADCREILPQLQNVDMIFADPPYFLSNGGITCHSGRMVSVDKGEWDKSMGIRQNYEFNKEWLSLCRDALKEDGTMWVSGTHHIIYSVGFAMQELGLKLLNSITWYKTNAPPNLSCRYFTHSTETVIWAAKSEKSKHCFNYEGMKREAGGKQMRDVWQISAPSGREKKSGKHPTQKPLALLDRIIRASTREGELIVDPFTGSSTTGIAAVALGRRFIGIDTEKSFLELSVKRCCAWRGEHRLF